MRPSLAIASRNAARLTSRPAQRAFATSASRSSPPRSQSGHPKPSPNSRWMSDLKTRMQKCLAGNLAPEHEQRLKERLGYVESHALELSAGREGFLTEERLRGLDRHQVAWGDMDSMVSHVNNVLYNRYAESGRVNWALRFAETADPKHKQEWLELMTPRSIGLILASIKTDFKFPMTYPDQVTVMHKLLRKPDYSSDRIFLEALIYSGRHQRPAARCFEDIAVYDYRAGKKAPLKPFMVDELQKIYELQERRKHEVEREVAELHGLVEEVEGSAA